MKKNFYDIVVIGAGASGLSLANAAGKEKKILVLERNEKPGAKILASGNGRCNVTNENDENFVEVIAFLSSLGVVTRTEDEGRVYPYSEESRAVLDALTESLGENVEIRLNSDVTSVKWEAGSFAVKLAAGEEIKSEKLAIASGGKSYPSLGTTGDSANFAKALGHKINPLIPGLTPIEVEENIKELDGVRQKAGVSLYKDGKKIAYEKGEVQFKEKSLSGICIMNLSNFVRKDGKYELGLDFYEGREFDQKAERLTAILKGKLASYILKNKIDLHDLRLAVSGLSGWKEAQITCGGVALGEVNCETFESSIRPGLYILGEALDYQERCGGFNMSHAIFTGLRAGKDLR